MDDEKGKRQADGAGTLSEEALLGYSVEGSEVDHFERVFHVFFDFVP